MSQQQNAFNDLSPTWLRNIGVVEVFGNFKSHFDQVGSIRTHIANQIRNAAEKKIIEAHLKDTESMFDFDKQSYKASIFGEDDVNQHMFKPHFSDTSLGGGDVWNPYYQFNDDDDIVLPITSIDGEGYQGYGTIYQEMIVDNQKILYITCGVPVFKGFSFYDSYNSTASDIHKTGRVSTANAIGKGIGTAIALAFSFVLPMAIGSKLLSVVTPARWKKAASLVGAAGGAVYIGAEMYSKLVSTERNITRYYDFRSAMPLYYMMVNSILTKIVVSLGMVFPVGNINSPENQKAGMVFDTFESIEQSTKITDTMIDYFKERPTTLSTVIKKLMTSTDLFTNKDAVARSSLPWERDNIPYVLQEGYDIFTVLNKRNRRFAKKYKLSDSGLSFKTTEELFGMTEKLQQLDEYKSEDESIAEISPDEFFKDAEDGILDSLGRIKDGYTGVNDYVGFRIEKGAVGGESFNNSTAVSEVASTINSISSSASSTKFKYMLGETGDDSGVFNDIIDNVKNLISGIFSSSEGSGAIAIATGNGKYDIPEEWIGSEFSKNYSFDLKLRARYGNYISILYDLYYPLALWLAATLPRGVGGSLYQSPFILQYHVQGLSSSTLAIVQSLNLTRGESEFGFSKLGLPLALDLKIQLKDLSPAMFASLGRVMDSVSSVEFENSTLLDFITTLTGVGIRSKSNVTHEDLRHKLAALQQVDTTLFNSTFWQYYLGDKIPVVKGLAHLGWFGFDRQVDPGVRDMRLPNQGQP